MAPFSVLQCLAAQWGYTREGQNLEAGSIPRSSIPPSALQAQIFMQVSKKGASIPEPQARRNIRAVNMQLTPTNFFLIP